jgi:outer membrane immunogenic protein
MRKRLLAATALVTIMLMAPGAFAQDGVVDWSGPYVGASVGGAAGNTNFDFAYTTSGSPQSPVSVPTLGVSGTITAGFNVQQDQFVYGIAADGTFLTLGGSASSTSPIYTIDTRLDALLSLRGRLGLTGGPVLYYATAGIAAGHVTYNANLSVSSPLPAQAPAVGNAIVFGPTYGVGVEYALNDSISLTTEGIVTNLGPVTATGDNGKSSGGAYTANGRTNSLNLRSGVNVHF